MSSEESPRTADVGGGGCDGVKQVGIATGFLDGRRRITTAERERNWFPLDDFDAKVTRLRTSSLSSFRLTWAMVFPGVGNEGFGH